MRRRHERLLENRREPLHLRSLVPNRLAKVFKVHEIPAGSAQSTEPLGTKYKFWYEDPVFGTTLFKEGRPTTGENWAEKIACELAACLDLPHATYEFARYEDRSGVLSPSLVARGARVVHGNELLASISTDYLPSQGGRYRNPNHTLRRVLAYLRGSAESLGAPYGWARAGRIQTALDFFIGYLMFDAWIANQDRHDENWGVLRMNDGNLFLAPTFDHGSSMARNEPDEKRLIRLTTKDMPRHISRFVCQAKSGFFPAGGDRNVSPLCTLEAFEQAALQSPNAAKDWCERLAAVRNDRVKEIVHNVPADWMSDLARRFTVELLRLNRERILKALHP